MMRQVEQVIWSPKSYPLTQFVKLYSDNLSQLIIVQQGYLGDSEVETFSKDQIMKIHGLSSQDRVVATDSRNNVLSIPVNYPIEFEVVGAASKPRKLFDILKTRHLPISVQFAHDKNRKFYIGNSVKETQDFGTLKLMRIYKEKYLMGNYINKGILDGGVVVVPMYVDIKVGVAMGFGESLKAKWEAFISVINSAVSEFDFQDDNGYKEITLYNAGADYGTVKPKQIVRMNVGDDRPGEDKETYRKIDLEEKFPLEPPQTRPKWKKYVPPFSEVGNIVWAKKDYEFKDFYEKFCEDLPQLIITTTGYYGQTELDSVGQDQVIRIQTYSRQKRVIARNSNDHYLSIPIGFDVKMRTFDAQGKLFSRPRTLQQIIEESPLPVKACFIQSQNGFAYSSRNNPETYNMGILELEDTYNETYFLGSSVFQGELDPRVMVIPVYLDISVAIAECFIPDIELDWDQFLTSLATAASRVDYNIPAPNQSIAMYSQDQIRVGEGIYEFLSPSNYVSYMGGNEADDGNYTELLPNSGTRGNQYYAAIPGDEAHESIRPTETASDNNQKTKRSSLVPAALRVLPVPVKSQNTPPLPVRPKPVTTKKQISLDETVRMHRNSTPHYDDEIGRATVLPIQHNSSKQAVDQGRQPGIKDKDQIASLRRVNPNRSFQSISQTTPTVSQMTATVSKKTERKFSDISEVPDDISELTVEDVCECLKLLNLQKHEKAFKELQIDGSLLKSLCAKVFQEDDHFNMSVVETIKLEKFIKGWRPRLQLNTVYYV